MTNSAEDLVREFMAVMDEAKDAAHRSVLDGTVSCRTCRSLVLESNVEGHYAWHARTDRWTTDAPSWLVGVDPPEDQPGSILPAQRSQIMAVYTALGIRDRLGRMADVRATLELPDLESTNELSHQQAARLLENLHERHSGKMTRR